MQLFREMVGHARGIALLQSFLKTGEVPHALLFSGEEGIGKRTLAETFVAALLCTGDVNLEMEPCTQCLSCKRLEDHNYPDFHLIEPEEQTIKIDQILKLQEVISYKPLAGEKTVVVIDPADKMNLQAANALLKTLEEPTPHTLLILISSKPFSLPVTLLSRCQKVFFYPLSHSQIETILMNRNGLSVSDARLLISMTGGRLKEAVLSDVAQAREREAALYSLISDETLLRYETLFKVATTFSETHETLTTALHYLSAWFRDVLVMQTVAEAKAVSPTMLVYAWRHNEILRWAGRMNTHEVAKFIADMGEIQQAQIRNINRQLALETLLMRLRDKATEVC